MPTTKQKKQRPRRRLRQPMSKPSRRPGRRLNMKPNAKQMRKPNKFLINSIIVNLLNMFLIKTMGLL